MAKPRFTESRSFGPSLEWEELPIVGQSQPARINWGMVLGVFGAVLFQAGLIVALIRAWG